MYVINIIWWSSIVATIFTLWKATNIEDEEKSFKWWKLALLFSFINVFILGYVVGSEN